MSGINWNELNITERFQELYKIVQEIKEGKRLHQQYSYHTNIITIGEETGNDDIPYEYSCATAHCIAGWMQHEQYIVDKGKEHLKYLETEKKIQIDSLNDKLVEKGEEINEDQRVRYKEFEFEEAVGTHDIWENDAWNWALYILELDSEEANSLFVGYLTIEEIEQNLQHLMKVRGISI